MFLSYFCDMDRKIFRLAVPNIISNITVPLLGMIDLAIAGHLDSTLYIGAISLGVTIFNMVYWNFGFIRMSTSGFTSQALGARNLPETMHILLRSVGVGVALSLIILLLQYPIGIFAQSLIKSAVETKQYVMLYFRICVWGAPAVLVMYAFNGWFIGMQNAKTPMYIAIFNNVLNIILSFTFVYLFHMKIEGIALGTVLSQIITLMVTIVVWRKHYGKLKKYISRSIIFDKNAIRNFFKVNVDVFIRTFLLTLVTTFFTFASTAMGDLILAVNSLLMQFFMLFSYFMDGFAYAGEALTGKYIGARDGVSLKRMLRRLFFWGLMVSLISAVIYLFFPEQLLYILTDKPNVIAKAKEYLFWTILIPITGFAAFLWDGIFIGATASKQMRNAMILSAIAFFTCYYLSVSSMGNNGLWLSFILYLLVRGVAQGLWAKRALRMHVG